MRTHRLLFTLTMPGNPSASSAWRDPGRRPETLVRSVPDDRARQLLAGHGLHWYRWPDGWTAQVAVRELRPRERAPKDTGFAGYGWMVASLIRSGEIQP